MNKSLIITMTDTETTGLDPMEDEIIQIAAMKVLHPKDSPERPILMEGDFLEIKVFPTKPVPPEVAALNGYDPEVWEREAMPLTQALVKYFRFLEWTQFGGQNPHFDMSFIQVASKKTGIPMPRMAGYSLIGLDTLALPLKLMGKIPNTKQESLVRYFDLGEQTHEALSDIRQASEIYTRLIRPYAEVAVSI